MAKLFSRRLGSSLALPAQIRPYPTDGEVIFAQGREWGNHAGASHFLSIGGTGLPKGSRRGAGVLACEFRRRPAAIGGPAPGRCGNSQPRTATPHGPFRPLARRFSPNRSCSNSEIHPNPTLFSTLSCLNCPLCINFENMDMRPAIALTAFGLLLAGFPAAAQNPPQHNWDISKVDVSKLPPAADQKGVTFDKDILPLFKASCVGCHNEQANRKPRGGLRLDTLDAALKGGKDGKMVIPGDSTNSLLVAAAAQIDDKIVMPPKRRARGGPGGGPGGGPPPGGPGGGPEGGAGGPPPGQDAGAGGPPPGGGPGGQGRGGPPSKPLTAEQVGLVRAWIDQGAK